MGFIKWAAARERENCRNILQKQEYNIYANINKSERVDYGLDKRQHMEIICPKDLDSIQGYIINIHGGGLIAGSIEQNLNFTHFLAAQGFMVFVIEYRLIPEVTFDQQLHDILKAFNHIEAEYIDDQKPVYLVADSAGCHLALIANAIGADIEVQKAFETEISHNLHFKGVWLNSPMIETTGFNKIGIFMARHFYGKRWRKTPKAKYLKNPELLYPYLPNKTVLLTSTGDDIRKQAMRAWNDIMNINDIGPAIAFGLKNHEHDWNVLFPNQDDFTKDINIWLLNCMIGNKTIENEIN